MQWLGQMPKDKGCQTLSRTNSVGQLLRHQRRLVLQRAITGEAEVGAGRKVFDLQLDRLGPYSLAFTRSGRHMLLGGRKGHLALMDWQRAQLLSEHQVCFCP